MSWHPLEAHHLPGIGPLRRARLAEAGIGTLEALVRADDEKLLSLPGFNATVLNRAREAAQALLQAPPPPPLPDVPSIEELNRPKSPEPVVVPALRRGLHVARRLETTLDWTRQARAHAKAVGADSKPLRQELKRVRRAVERVQHESLRDGLSPRSVDDLVALVTLIDARLIQFVARKPKLARMEKLLPRVTKLRKQVLERLDR